MGYRLLTYREEFTPGTRVVVACHPDEASSDVEFDGRAGVVVEFKGWCKVRLDRPPKGRPRDVWLMPHNLKITRARRALTSPEREAE